MPPVAQACGDAPEPRSSTSVARHLVISLAGIGDTLMATPLIRELPRRFPGIEVEALVLWPGSAQVLAGNPHLAAVHQHDFLKSGRLASLRFTLGLRRRRYDVSFTTHPQGRREYRLITRLIGARHRLSHAYENQQWIDRLLVTDSLPQDYGIPCAANNLALLRLLGAEPDLTQLRPDLFLDHPEKSWAEDWLHEHHLHGVPWLGVHVGSGGTKNLALRRWPAERYADLFPRFLAARPDWRIVLFGGPEERAVHEELRRRVPDPRLLIPLTPGLRHAAAMLARARAFLSVDTAFMHLATAMKVPRQFVIETPTLNPSVCPPRPDWIRIPNPGIQGRHLDFYRYDGRQIAGTDREIRALMEQVTVDAVLAALLEQA